MRRSSNDRVPWPPKGVGYLTTGAAPIQQYKDISSSPLKLSPITQQAYRDIQAKLRTYLRESSVKIFITGGAVHFTFQMIMQISFRTLEDILKTPTLKDVIIWNMKEAKDLEHTHFNSAEICTTSGKKYADHGTSVPSATGVKTVTTPMGSHSVATRLLPIVLECVLYDPEDNPKTQEVITDTFRERYTIALQNKNDQLTELMSEIPVKYDAMKIKDAGLMAAIKESIGLLLIEFDEEVPHISTYEKLTYSFKDIESHTRLHIISFLNPATVSVRKLMFIHARFLSYIKAIKFNTKEQERTSSADGILLSFIFSERLKDGLQDLGGMMRNRKNGAKRYQPY